MWFWDSFEIILDRESRWIFIFWLRKNIYIFVVEKMHFSKFFFFFSKFFQTLFGLDKNRFSIQKPVFPENSISPISYRQFVFFSGKAIKWIKEHFWVRFFVLERQYQHTIYGCLFIFHLQHSKYAVRWLAFIDTEDMRLTWEVDKDIGLLKYTYLFHPVMIYEAIRNITIRFETYG